MKQDNVAGLGMFILGLGILAWIAVSYLRGQIRTFDFASYYYATHYFAQGGNPYSWSEVKSVSPVDASVYPFLYTPVCLYLLSPFTQFPIFLAQFIFSLLNIFAFAASLLWTAKLVALIRDPSAPVSKWSPLFVAAMSGWLLLYPAIFNMWSGQINMVLLAAIAGSLYFGERGKPIQAGILLGIAGVIKILPIGFLVYFLFRKQYRAALWAGVTFILIVGISYLADPQIWRQFFSGVHLAGFGKTAPGLVAPSSAGNIGWAGAFARLFGNGTPSSIMATFGAIGLIISIMAIYRRHLLAKVTAGSALFLVTTLVVLSSPLVWLHYMVFYVPAVALLLDSLSTLRTARYPLLLFSMTILIAGGYYSQFATRVHGKLTHWTHHDYVNKPPLVIQPFYALNLIALSCIGVWCVRFSVQSSNGAGAKSLLDRADSD